MLKLKKFHTGRADGAATSRVFIRKSDSPNAGSKCQVKIIKRGFRSVKAELGEEDYSNACDAHKEGKHIEIKGNLDMSSKNWKFIHVDKFTIIV